MTGDFDTSRLLPSLEADPYQSQPAAAGPSPIALVLGALRGRYVWAAGIGGGLALLGVAAGVLLPRPLYSSVGMIEIAPTVPRILYHSEEKGVPPMFEAYVAAQQATVTSPRVVEIAMSTPEWRRFDRGISDRAVADFRRSLACDNPRRSQFLAVSFTDEEPEAAAVAVNQVIKAYMSIVDERESEAGASRYGVLTTKQANLANRLAGLRSDVLAATDNLGAAAIQKRYDYLVEQINRDDALIHELDIEIAAAKDAGTALTADPNHVPTADELSVHDDELNNLLIAEAQKKNEIEFLLREGRGERHPLVETPTRELLQIRVRIEDRVERLLRGQAAGGAPLLAAQGIDEKIARRARIGRLRESASDEAKVMMTKLAEVANLQGEQAIVDGELDQIKRRLAQIDLESESQGRISVMTRGSRPVMPESDRRAALAVAGGGGGLALGFAAVVLWGLRNARIRHIADVGGGATRSRFLGILPDLHGDDEDGAETAVSDAAANMADYCVHHVRTMLQLGHASPGRVVALTSPSPGAGKTTLAWAIGSSFGASGARTLVIDCDLVGHGLTSSMADVTCGVARAVLHGRSGTRGVDGAPTHEGFVMKFLAGRETGVAGREFESLREDCRQRASLLDPAEGRVVRAVEAMARYRGAGEPGATRRRGLLDALTGTSLDDCVVETCFPNLSVLPVGEATARDAERLSPAALDRLLAACRSRFDVILVDTGPILGSLEAAFVTVKADDVVFVVPCGELKSAVDEAMRRLESAGARIAGVVFNRARREDAARSSYVSRPSGVSPEAA